MKRLFASTVLAFCVLGSAQALAQDAAAAQDLYNDNCAICHGNKGEGIAKSAVPDGAVQVKKLAGDAAYWDFAVFKKTVMEGLDDENHPMRVMPVFGKTGLYEPAGQQLTDQNLKDIQAYMQTFGPKEE